MSTQKIDIQRYSAQSFDEWDDLVWAMNNGTMFHTRRFLSYHPGDRFTDHSLFFSSKEKPLALFPAAEQIIDGHKWLVSHPGSSYGSFVVPEHLSFANSYALVKSLKQHATAQGFFGIRLTLPPTIYNKRLSNYVDFALIKHGFHYAKRELSSILFLESSGEENLAKFRPSHRQAVRKAERRGVSVKPSDDYAAFYHILERNLSIRHGVTPTHSLEELKTLKQLFPDRINLFGAFVDNIMVAGVVNFVATDNVVLAFYISHDESYQDYRALNLLFYSIFDWAIKANLRVFDFGIFTVNEEPNWGLGRFKENFGASGMFRDTLEITL